MKATPPLPVPDYAAPALLAPTCVLTPGQIAFFHQHGYLAVEQVMPLEEISRVRVIYDRLFNEDRSRTEGDLYNLTGAKQKGRAEEVAQILQPGKYAPALLETQLVANLKALMKQLLGAETCMVGDHAINKPPHSPAATPWHQDEAYWNPAKEYRGLSIWVPLQPATKLNGCMHFVPGSHRLEVIPHQPIGNHPLTPGLEVVPGAYDFSSAVACELPAGGATIHLERTLHYTPANQSDDYRRAYIAVGTQFERPRATARRFPWQERQAAARAEQKPG
jgi:ectoine hydroxylase-related dioxygenase (phytanoyl-CoA dioxygenase family)